MQFGIHIQEVIGPKHALDRLYLVAMDGRLSGIHNDITSLFAVFFDISKATSVCFTLFRTAGAGNPHLTLMPFGVLALLPPVFLGEPKSDHQQQKLKNRAELILGGFDRIFYRLK